ncbi:predicted protein [Nematostella vectensis]|uniref:G-protein coupled receptors family 1 profile domain-containing protein n=1 Tax=Nematostella vectensis TaxID=45351 RepID=A7SJA0_NEMVE|nr:predicted protein [Nematostella vectensis]|eukprot:XP_001628300.1 predicted protein [Nematostella vectensis]
MTFISDHLPASMTSLLLRLALVASSGILSASITCSGTCVFSAQETNVVALCYRSASLDEIKKDISSTENITELTVASSNISTITGGVFAGFTALRNLSLTFNNIHTIRARGFAGLNKLEYLNMSGNRISTWEIDRDTELRLLVVLDISGNKALSNTLPPFILTLPSLRTVHGVTLNDNCQSCTLKPQFRMSVVTVRRLIVAAWGMGTTVALFPLVGIGTYAGNTFCVPIDPSRENPYTFHFSTSLTLFAIILYLTTIPLYIKIFLFVRSNQLQRGVRKEGALAKKIAILVLSNMVFFFLPVFFAALLLLAPKMFEDFSMINMSLLTATVPTILTSINAMCNPLLYAFRHGHFIRALKICLGCTHSLDTFREHSSSFGSTSQKMEARKQTNCSG